MGRLMFEWLKSRDTSVMVVVYYFFITHSRFLTSKKKNLGKTQTTQSDVDWDWTAWAGFRQSGEGGSPAGSHYGWTTCVHWGVGGQTKGAGWEQRGQRGGSAESNGPRPYEALLACRLLYSTALLTPPCNTRHLTSPLPPPTPPTFLPSGTARAEKY